MVAVQRPVAQLTDPVTVGDEGSKVLRIPVTTAALL
jgi:hypothetical protein